MSECVIYDFETLSQDQSSCVVLSFAMLSFSEKRYIDDPYTYSELLDSCKYIKFDVQDQVDNFGRSMSKDTLEWWSQQGDKARQLLKPSELDVSIALFPQWINDNVDRSQIKKSFTRGNTFDPMILQYLMRQLNCQDPFHWGSIRDTRSYIEGMAFGFDVKNNFTLDELESQFVKHDPRHDIAMDVMRMQFLAQVIITKD